MFLRALIFTVIIFGMVISSCPAQEEFGYSQEAEVVFSQGIELFSKGNYAEALPLFDSLIALKPIHQRTTAAYIMAGKALYQLHNFQESARILGNLVKTFGETHYADDAHYTLALDYMMLQWYDGAALQFLRSIEGTDDLHLSEKATALFESLAEERLNVQDLRALTPKLKANDVRDLVRLKLAEKYYLQGDSRESVAVLDEIPKKEVPGRYDSRISTLRMNLGKSGSVKIGVVLPLMKSAKGGSIQSMAEEMLDGVNFALNEHKSNAEFHPAVSIEVKDTGYDTLTALNAVRDLSESKDVVAIIGPVFSNITAACAPAANRAAVPLITPTAIATGIANIGPYIFQANPDYEIRGRAMAHYAVLNLGFKTLAVLSSEEPMGRAMAESFVREARRLGAAVVARESYAKGASDLRDQITAIKKAGLQSGDQKNLTGSTERPVTSIEGIFIPVSDAEEIGVIASQITYFNIKTQLLGGGEWYDIVQLEANKRYVNGVIFASDSYLDPGDPVYSAFEKKFTSGLGKQPSKYTLFGYDTMSLLLTLIEEGENTRTKLSAALSSVEGFPGIHSKITLSRRRVNSEMHILKYLNGEITKLHDIAVK